MTTYHVLLPDEESRTRLLEITNRLRSDSYEAQRNELAALVISWCDLSGTGLDGFLRFVRECSAMVSV